MLLISYQISDLSVASVVEERLLSLESLFAILACYEAVVLNGVCLSETDLKTLVQDHLKY